MHSVCILIYVWINLYSYPSNTIYLDLLQLVLESISRCAWKRRSSELWDTLQGYDGACLETHLEAVIEQNWRGTSWPWSNELRDSLQHRDWVTVRTHLEAISVPAWRLKSSDFGDALGGSKRPSEETCTWRASSCVLGRHDWASFKIHIEVAIEQVCRL
jgi:hypothetical protein